MLVQILRIHLGALSCGAPAGWLSALADPRIGAALGAIHAEPGRGWTLEALARVAGVSRTSLRAQRFKALAGTTVMNYLTRWRMHTAAERLRSGDESISAIAFSRAMNPKAPSARRSSAPCNARRQYRRRGGALPLTV